MGQAKDPTHSCGGLDKDYTWVWGGLQDEHAVAVGEEAVPGLHGVAIGFENNVPAGEGGDQHQQRGLRQMKVGQQGIDDLEAMAGGEED